MAQSKKSYSAQMPKTLVILYQAMYDPWLTIAMEGSLKTWVKELKDSSEYFDFKMIYAKVPNRWIRRIDLWIFYSQFSSQRFQSLAGKYLSIIFRLMINVLSYGESFKIVDKDRIEIQNWDFILRGSLKTRDVLRIASGEKVDYIAIVGASSYFNVQSYATQCKAWPRQGFVGAKFVPSGGSGFPSGSFRIFSRDVVMELLESDFRWSWFYLQEDVALGRMLQRMNVPIFDLPWLKVDSVEEVNVIPMEELRKVIQIRCKVELDGVRVDHKLMQVVHQKITSS